jgi:hypothetical protein
MTTSARQHLCPAGLFSGRLQLTSEEECEPCTAGNYLLNL